MQNGFNAQLILHFGSKGEVAHANRGSRTIGDIDNIRPAIDKHLGGCNLFFGRKARTGIHFNAKNKLTAQFATELRPVFEGGRIFFIVGFTDGDWGWTMNRADHASGGGYSFDMVRLRSATTPY